MRSFVAVLLCVVVNGFVVTGPASVRDVAVRATKREPSKRIKLLTREQEYALSYKVQELLSWEATRKELSETLQRQPSEIEWARAVGFDTAEAFKKAWKHALHAKVSFICHNLPLVKSVARRYNVDSGSLDHADLVQEGTLGLNRAVERFDPSRGLRFSTYAVWWIRASISSAIANQNRIIRIPAAMHHQILLMQRTTRSFERENGRLPSNVELADLMQLPLHRILLLRQRTHDVISVNTKVYDGSSRGDRDLNLIDVVPSPDPGPAEVVQKAEIRRSIFNVMRDTLDERERQVLALIFGLNDMIPRSMEEVGKHLGISGNVVRSVKARALNKLRQPSSGNRALKWHYHMQDRWPMRDYTY